MSHKIIRTLSGIENPQKSNPQRDRFGSTAKSCLGPGGRERPKTAKRMWSLLREAVRTRDGRGATFLEAQRRRKKLLATPHVEHTQVTVPVAETIADMDLCVRRGSGFSQLKHLELRARMHRNSVSNARTGVDTSTPDALKWMVEHDLRNAHDRLPSLKLPRTVKRHTSMNRLLDMKFQQKWHKRCVGRVKSRLDNKLSTQAKRYRRNKNSARAAGFCGGRRRGRPRDRRPRTAGDRSRSRSRSRNTVPEKDFVEANKHCANHLAGYAKNQMGMLTGLLNAMGEDLCA